MTETPENKPKLLLIRFAQAVKLGRYEETFISDKPDVRGNVKYHIHIDRVARIVAVRNREGDRTEVPFENVLYITNDNAKKKEAPVQEGAVNTEGADQANRQGQGTPGVPVS